VSVCLCEGLRVREIHLSTFLSRAISEPPQGLPTLQVVEPPLPPPAEYEDSLRRRLESSFVKESSRALEDASEQPTGAATSSARPPAAVDAATARWRARRGVANPSALTSTGYPQSPKSLGGNSIVIGPSSSAW
jgi:hypothetical protein